MLNKVITNLTIFQYKIFSTGRGGEKISWGGGVQGGRISFYTGALGGFSTFTNLLNYKALIQNLHHYRHQDNTSQHIFKIIGRNK